MSRETINLGRVGFVDRGNYDHQSTYYEWDMVTFEGSSYVLIHEGLVEGISPTTESYWKCVARKGDKGDKPSHGWSGTSLRFENPNGTWAGYVNLKGDTGATGSNGVNATITGATATKLAPGATPTVTLGGNASARTFAFGIPEGAKGDKGDTGIGVPIGGTTGQQLMKKSNVDYDFEWKTPTVVNVSHLLPKSGGTLENYVEKLVITTGAINLNSGNVFHRDATANTTFSITNAKAGAHSFTLIITMGATVRTLTFPASVKWQDGEVPEMTEANKTYILTFMTINSGTTWFGMEGGNF